jgi:hypothetical protein
MLARPRQPQLTRDFSVRPHNIRLEVSVPLSYVVKGMTANPIPGVVISPHRADLAACLQSGGAIAYLKVGTCKSVFRSSKKTLHVVMCGD